MLCGGLLRQPLLRMLAKWNEKKQVLENSRAERGRGVVGGICRTLKIIRPNVECSKKLRNGL